MQQRPRKPIPDPERFLSISGSLCIRPRRGRRSGQGTGVGHRTDETASELGAVPAGHVSWNSNQEAIVENPVVHFEIMGPDGPALRSFYEELFGWQLRGPDGQLRGLRLPAHP